MHTQVLLGGAPRPDVPGSMAAGPPQSQTYDTVQFMQAMATPTDASF
jgi:hypothetical protein